MLTDRDLSAVAKGEPGTGLRPPVRESMEYAEMLSDVKFTT